MLAYACISIWSSAKPSPVLHYRRRAPFLYLSYANAKLGYKNPGEMRNHYAKFYWQVVSPYIQDALKYLRITLEGKQWIANLYAHVFASEHAQG